MEYNEDDDTLLKNARRMAEAGQQEEALKLVRRVVVSYPDQVDGWWVLANLTDDMEEKRYALKQALALKGDHTGALKLQSTMKKRRFPSWFLWFWAAALILVIMVIILLLFVR
jgi:predicted Zn-dependent protease